MSSYTTLFDMLMGTDCHIRGRRIALTGSSGSFGSAMKDLLERAGAVVVPLRFGVDYTYENYAGTDHILATADILVLAHGAKGAQAMQANCDSFLWSSGTPYASFLRPPCPLLRHLLRSGERPARLHAVSSKPPGSRLERE